MATNRGFFAWQTIFFRSRPTICSIRFGHDAPRLLKQSCLHTPRRWSSTPTVSSSSSSSSSSTTTLLLTTVFREQVEQGTLKADLAQEKVVKRLTRLQQALVDYDNQVLFRPPPLPVVEAEVLPPHERPMEESKEIIPNDSSSPTTSPTSSSAAAPAAVDQQEAATDHIPPLKIPRGLYLYGPVGTGKSMLMDAFFHHAPVTNKSRYHFHSFLAYVHQQIHLLKQRDLHEKGRNFSVDTSQANNPIHRVGLEIAQSTSLLCLDEFQVTDIADALILSQLFGVLFAKGTVVVTTSNRPPQDLYEGGLNRSYFLPFLDLLQRHCIVYEIQSNLDYRRVLASCSSFFGTDVELQPIIRQVLQTIVQVEEDDVETAGRPLDLPVGFQRTIHTDYSYESVHSNLRAGRFDFGQLCDADVGSLDYKAIANYFDIVCLEHVPIMDLEGHNRARRFITLVDELYESKCCLVLSTLDDIDAPMALFRVQQQDSRRPDLEDPTTELGVDVATQGVLAVGSLASVRELSFAFERASSRIVEMCSRSWWDKRLGNLDDQD